jgi:hypothetical protein
MVGSLQGVNGSGLDAPGRNNGFQELQSHQLRRIAH